MNSKYSIALIGRTNVGKSTLFNKLVEKNQALTSATPNTTRDRNYGQVIWRGEEFRFIDTGGLDAFDFLDKISDNYSIEEQIIEQTNKSLAEADLLIFVIDGRVGVLPQEKTLASLLKKTKKPVIVVGNKIDNETMEKNVEINEIIKLNFGQPQLISAKSGRGSGDLLDAVFDMLKIVKRKKSKLEKLTQTVTPIKIALIGKPNVGKSSLLNTLLDEKHAIVSPVAHTTREPQDVMFTYKNQPFVIVDTVGIRKKAKIKQGMEDFGIQKSLDALEKADIAILVADSSLPLSVQDNYLANEVRKSGCGLIIAANKWDLVEDKQTNTINDYTETFYNFFPYLWWVPIVFMSALTKMRVKQLLDLAIKINVEKKIVIDEKELAVFTKKFIEHFKPVRSKGLGKPRIKSFVQAPASYPVFVLTLYPGSDLHQSYLKYIENQLRKTFGFSGVPIRIAIEKPRKKHSAPNQKVSSPKTGGSTRPRGVRR